MAHGLECAKRGGSGLSCIFRAAGRADARYAQRSPVHAFRLLLNAFVGILTHFQYDGFCDHE